MTQKFNGFLYRMTQKFNGFLYRMTPFDVVVGMIASVHLVWAFSLTANPAAGNVTSIHSLNSIVGQYEYLVYYFVAVTAFMSLWVFDARFKVLLSSFQQAVTMISAYGAMRAIWLSQFADGVVRPREFILADQHIWVIIAIAHGIGLVWLWNDTR